MSEPDTTLDCIIIGAGPGGLTAATYLLRYHRRVVVLDAGKSRARWIPTSHNAPGFPQGVGGTRLIEQQREQAVGHGATIEDAHVAQLERDADEFIATAADGRRWRAKFVILATGIVDVMPPLNDLESAIARGGVRLCPVCDGYEASDGRVAVYGPLESTIGHALFLRTFSRDVAVVPSDDSEATPGRLEEARRAGIEVMSKPESLAFEDEASVVRFADGREERFDTFYPTLGSSPNSQLATHLRAHCDECGEIVVDGHQQSSVDGLYAVGDVVSALNQIAVAVGHAAIAATAVHNRLPRNWREHPELQAETAQELPSPEGVTGRETSRSTRLP